MEREARNELERLVMLMPQLGHHDLAALKLQQNKGPPCRRYSDDEAYCWEYAGLGGAGVDEPDHLPPKSHSPKERRKIARIFDVNASLPHTRQGLAPE